MEKLVLYNNLFLKALVLNLKTKKVKDSMERLELNNHLHSCGITHLFK